LPLGKLTAMGTAAANDGDLTQGFMLCTSVGSRLQNFTVVAFPGNTKPSSSSRARVDVHEFNGEGDRHDN
jgi:hypothetical protein